MAVDKDNNVWISDYANERALEYDNPSASGGGMPGKPGSAGDTTADLVFGQGGSFTSNSNPVCSHSANPDSLCGPTGIIVDPAENVFIADNSSGRVLEYDDPLAPGGGTPGTPGSKGDTTADRVFGQGGYSARALREFHLSVCYGNESQVGGTPGSPVTNRPNPDGLCSPEGLALDIAGDLFVGDEGNSRVLKYLDPLAPGGGTPSVPGSAGDVTADAVLGQGNLNHGAANQINGASIGGFNGGGNEIWNGVAVDQSATPNRLYLSDSGNSRILAWKDITAFANGAPADLIFGQSDQFSHLCNLGFQPNFDVRYDTADDLCNPQGITVDSHGNLWVADRQNARVVEYLNPFAPGGGSPGTPGKAGDTTADVVLGQAALSGTGGQCPTNATTRNNLCGPQSVSVDNRGDVFVGDTGDGRVVEYSTPITNGMNANLVFGQNGVFTTSFCNGSSGNISADTLCNPNGVALDTTGDLYVTDYSNDRMLEYDNPLAAGGGTPGKPGAAGDTTADLVFGAPNFTSNGAA